MIESPTNIEQYIKSHSSSALLAVNQSINVLFNKYCIQLVSLSLDFKYNIISDIASVAI